MLSRHVPVHQIVLNKEVPKRSPHGQVDFPATVKLHAALSCMRGSGLGRQVFLLGHLGQRWLVPAVCSGAQAWTCCSFIFPCSRISAPGDGQFLLQYGTNKAPVQPCDAFRNGPRAHAINTSTVIRHSTNMPDVLRHQASSWSVESLSVAGYKHNQHRTHAAPHSLHSMDSVRRLGNLLAGAFKRDVPASTTWLTHSTSIRSFCSYWTCHVDLYPPPPPEFENDRCERGQKKKKLSNVSKHEDNFTALSHTAPGLGQSLWWIMKERCRTKSDIVFVLNKLYV